MKSIPTITVSAAKPSQHVAARGSEQIFRSKNVRVLRLLADKNVVCSHSLKHQGTPEIPGVPCDHLFTLRFPSWESVADHPAAVIQVFIVFQIDETSLNDPADRRLA
jgi:hypothetical protein